MSTVCRDDSLTAKAHSGSQSEIPKHRVGKTQSVGSKHKTLVFVTPLLGVYPEALRAGTQRGICTPVFIAA